MLSSDADSVYLWGLLCLWRGLRVYRGNTVQYAKLTHATFVSRQSQLFFSPRFKRGAGDENYFFSFPNHLFLASLRGKKKCTKYKARLVKYDRSLLCMCSLGDDNEAFSDDFHRSAVLLEALGLYSVHNCGFVSSFLTLNVLYSKHRTPLGSHTSPSVATHELCFESHDLSVTINSSLSLYSKGDVMFTSQNQADSLVVSMELFSKRVELFPCTVNKLWPLCL